MPNPLGKYKFIDAAIIILEKSAQPRKTKEIINEALKLGFIKTYGRTPNQTLNGILNKIVNSGGVYKGHKIAKAGKGSFFLKK